MYEALNGCQYEKKNMCVLLTVTFAQAKNFSINVFDLDNDIFVSFVEVPSQIRQMDWGIFVMDMTVCCVLFTT